MLAQFNCMHERSVFGTNHSCLGSRTYE